MIKGKRDVYTVPSPMTPFRATLALMFHVPKYDCAAAPDRAPPAAIQRDSITMIRKSGQHLLKYDTIST
jgi:hypothetical protein